MFQTMNTLSVFPNSLFLQDNVSCHIAKIVYRNCLRNSSTWPLNFDRTTGIFHSNLRGPTPKLTRLKESAANLGAKYYRTPRLESLT